MIKKTLTYTDYNEVERTEDFYFNISKGELIEMELRATTSETLGMADLLKKIQDTRDGKGAAELFKDVVARSFGVKSVDGARFMKSPELVAEFESTGAHSELLFELVMNADKAAEFMNGLMPKNLASDVKREVSKAQSARTQSEANMQGFQKKQETVQTVQVVPDLPPVTPEVLTKIDLESMSQEELMAMVQKQQSGTQALLS